MRTGKGESLHPIMPWTAFSGLTEQDLGAIYDALGDAYPVAHYVGNIGEPRHCAVCGQEHPFGEYNHLVLPKSVPVADNRARTLGWHLSVRRNSTGRSWSVATRTSSMRAKTTVPWTSR